MSNMSLINSVAGLVVGITVGMLGVYFLTGKNFLKYIALIPSDQYLNKETREELKSKEQI